jgi:hypothetical protein
MYPFLLKPNGKMQLVRHRHDFEDKNKMDLKETGWEGPGYSNSVLDRAQ